MTIEEAEEYYKRYLGHGFHMGREEPGNYEAFKQLNVSKEYLTKWDNDLLESQFNQLWKHPEKVWVYQQNIYEIIDRGNVDTEKMTSRLLDEIDKMDCLSSPCTTLLIENMAGRTYHLRDGGVYFFCKKTKQSARMKEIMDKIINHITDRNQRYRTAVETYQKALRQFSGK